MTHAAQPIITTRVQRDGFTLVELLIVIAIIGVLIGILLPTIGAARSFARNAACGSNLRQLGIATRSYLNDNDERLPQVWIDNAFSPNPAIVEPSDTSTMVGSLFAGKLGTLPVFGVNRIGPQRRPLNSYLGVSNPPTDESQWSSADLQPEDYFQVEALHDPSDRGGYIAYISAFGMDSNVRSMYDLLGSSYVINDHTLQPNTQDGSDEFSTLIPRFEPSVGFVPRGGRMPRVTNPNRTWMMGDHPIYNFDRLDQSDPLAVRNGRAHTWHGRDIRANLLFVDLHVGTNLAVPHPRTVNYGEMFSDDDVRALNTTNDYTFLPHHEWMERYDELIND